MADSRDRARDDRVYDTFTRLRRHLGSCKDCTAAMKGHDPYAMCRDGLYLTLMAAKQYGDLVTLRRKAYNSHAHTFFACPDLRAHGKSYEVTATPLMAVAIQEGMF